MEMFWYGSPGRWGWALGLGSLLFWALLAVAMIVLFRQFMRGAHRLDPPYPGYASGAGPYGQPAPAPGQVASPEQILAERFARGEINQDEFYERIAPPHPGPAAGPS